MKKKLFTGFLSALLLVIMAVCGFAGCKKKGEETPSSSVPAASESANSSDNTESSDSFESANSSDNTESSESSESASSSESSSAETQTFTVEFKNGDKSMKTVEVEGGGTATYVGMTPTKAATAQYAYTFRGWALEDAGAVVDLSTYSITKNETFYAVFAESVRSYSVTWNIDGETTSESFEYGVTPEYKGATPTKPTVGNTSYTFMGWADSLSGDVLNKLPTVTGEVTYYAVFDEVTTQTTFTVTWKNGDESLETDENVEFDAVPTYNGATPEKAPTAENVYTFVGWATSVDGEKLAELPLVTADVTYYAVFEASARPYTITWVIEGKEETSQCAYGSVPSYEGTPVKADSEECSFKFDGWAPEVDGGKFETLPTVDGEATYYAVFVVDKVFEAPKFTSGNIMYSARTQEVFLPEGLLVNDVTIASAVLKIADETEELGYRKVNAYENGAWIYDLFRTTTVTDEDGNVNTVNVEEQNAVVTHTSEIELSDGTKYTVSIDVYAGVIDEFSDFPAFFNNEATEAGYAPVTYGYYVLIKDLGSATYDNVNKKHTFTDELAFTQCANTDFSNTCGFNGTLNGMGHTLRFKLTSGGLVGMVLGNGAIENLGVIFEDATSTHYGAFGYITSGAPEIRNCYIEQTNNHYMKTTAFGVMGRPSGKLRLHNTVIYGYNIGMDNTLGSTTLNENSSQAYVIHGRWNADTFGIASGYTKVYIDGIENGSREVLLSEIEDASKFNDEYWYKTDDKLVWKGLGLVTVTWIANGEEVSKTYTVDSKLDVAPLPNNTSTETQVVSYGWSESEGGEVVVFHATMPTATKTVTYYLVERTSTRYYTVTWNIDGVISTTQYEYDEMATHDNPVKEEDDNYTYEFKGWSRSENGELVELGAVTVDGITYYAVFERTPKTTAITIAESILYSTGDNQLFLPEEVEFSLDETVTVVSADGATVYYENGAWTNTFALTSEQITANAIGMFDIKLVKGEDTYLATVKSYAGVIDELSDFPKFFDNEATEAGKAPATYGYYVIVKNIGALTDDLTMTQCAETDFTATCGFNGIVDGLGHTVQFNLKSGALFGMILGNCTIQNLAVEFNDNTATHYGVFGYITNGAPKIVNCFIKQANNHYQKTTTYGLMARPNGKLILENTVVWGANITLDNTTFASTANISASSKNAYVIWGRAGFAIATNFTEVSTSGAITDSGLSALDSSYWTTTDNKPSWKTAADLVYSVITVTVA